MAEYVKFPTFEVAGPPCKTPDCKGVLTAHMTLDLQKAWHECHICKAKFTSAQAYEIKPDSPESSTDGIH